ncbi:MAG: metal-binding protein [Proteobacteria bacterium]|nr:metal-binding protein [Pseudomonadota bacterium]
MHHHRDLTDADVFRLIRRTPALVGGHCGYKIYGTLTCKGGKRMKRSNRVFFASVQEAEAHGYRPCGNCMRDAYKAWKGKQTK